jgi:phosphoribosyl 1,2-cyclic phosphodiesterase
MEVTLWGVRGSTPTPQPENIRYGGNTACVAVRLNGRLYIFDCGTGFRNLGKQLSREYAGRPLQAHIFISHYHWDHIQGIPFFSPLYDNPENHFFFHSSNRTCGLQEAIEGQMVLPYFPVKMNEMAARREFYSLEEGCASFEDCRILTRHLNHPQGCLGFRIESPTGCLVYATDHEPGNPQFDKAVRELAEGADVLISDAQYLPEEYAAKRRGWGHSHWRESVEIALAAGAQQLILFHHDPDRSDSCLDALVNEAGDYHPKLRAAAEGMVIHI